MSDLIETAEQQITTATCKGDWHRVSYAVYFEQPGWIANEHDHAIFPGDEERAESIAKLPALCSDLMNEVISLQRAQKATARRIERLPLLEEAVRALSARLRSYLPRPNDSDEPLGFISAPCLQDVEALEMGRRALGDSGMEVRP